MGQQTPNLREIETLLRQGKTAPAVLALDKADLDAVEARDLLLLNRIGDLLARAGRAAEAIRCYEAIGTRFEESGFAPKAIALYKKVLKLDPRRWEAWYRIGRLNTEQKLFGEARAYLLRAVEGWLGEGAFPSALRACEALVAAEPDNPLHRVRLAEARAAVGDRDTAAAELLQLGRALLEAGRGADAERAFARAAELAADPEPGWCGQALALAAQGRHEAALERLRHLATPAARAMEALVLEIAGREEEAGLRLEAGADPERLVAYLRAVVEHPTLRARLERAWSRVDRTMRSWDPRARRAALEALADVEADGHLPALERMAALAREQGDTAAELSALRRMIRHHEARGNQEAAARLGARVQVLQSEPSSFEASGSAETTATGLGPEAPHPAPEADPLEAPAVPLSTEDHEYVAGQLTEAEVLSKYGLLDEALERLRAAVSRFPGHLDAQAKLAELLRGKGDRAALRDALLGLAVAQRAAGQHEAARQSAREAVRAAPLPQEMRARLSALGLLEESPTPGRPAAAAAAPARGQAREPVGAEAAWSAGETGQDSGPDQEEIEILVEEASTAAGNGGRASDKLDESTLEAIARSLEAQIQADLEPEVGPGAQGEETLEEVLATFKRHVEREVSADDHRTHYDLGIAYKEMGLVKEALEAFSVAARSPELAPDAHCMMAVCERERGNMAQAVRHYRRAIELRGATKELRYDLAEALLEQGNRDAALEEFKNLMQADPAYRDVRERVRRLTTPG